VQPSSVAAAVSSSPVADAGLRPVSPVGQTSPSRRLKIAYVHDGLYPYFKGGAERRFHQTARLLAERHDVSYVSWQYWNGPKEIYEDGVRLIGVGPARPFYGSDGKRTVGEALDFARRVTSVLWREQFDVIDCCATPLLALYISRFLTKARREPLVVTWHEVWDEYWRGYLPHRPLVGRLARLIESRAVPMADALVAVSRFTADKLRAKAPGKPIRVIENGVSLEAIDRAETDVLAPDLIFAGRLIDDKKVDHLLLAMKRLTQDVPGLTCGIVGEGPERQSLERMAGAIGITDRVRFFGFVPDGQLYGLIKGAKAFVLPSIREGFGMVVAEAQACRTVPITVRAPYNASTSLIRHAENGLVSNPGIESLASAIRQLLLDPAWREQLQQGARESAIKRDWPEITNQLERLYKAVIRRNACR
jgi:glycosyltransferase involved in cell wall biosynthesis